MQRNITSFLVIKKIIFAIFLAINLIFFYGFDSLAEYGYGSDFIGSEIKKTDEILVKFKDKRNIYNIKIDDKKNYNKILNDYKNNASVEYAEPDFLYKAAIIPSDIFFDNQWYLKKISAPDAWDAVTESSEIIVAVIDSGVQISHPDLKNNIWKNIKEIPDNYKDDDNNGFIDDVNGWDFVNNSSDPAPKFLKDFTQDGILHGTIISGIIAAESNNNIGITGISWHAKIMALKVLDDKGEGDTRNIIRAIDYAINNSADIINLSFVGEGYSQGLESAIKRAYEAGIIVVAAAGNEQAGGNGGALDKKPMYPACHDGKNGENMVIGVAATDTIDQKASFSSYGFKCVDISAPGVSIFSTSVYSPVHNIGNINFNNYYEGYWSGTSMAAPMVSGALALISGVNPGLSRKQIIDFLLQNTDNINRLNPNYLSQLGTGRLNIFKSAMAAKNNLLKNNYSVINAPFSNNSSQIKITDKNGKMDNKFIAYGDKFLGGVNVAAGDVDGDSRDEIITGPSSGGGPHIKIFDAQGNLKGQFFAYDKNFRGGVNVAVGNIIGGIRSSQKEIIVAPRKGGGPHIKIFNSNGLIISQFFAYNKKFKGGVNIASADFNYDGLDEILTGAGPGGTPHVIIFNKDGVLIDSFYAFDEKFNGGVNISTINNIKN
jgi:subtilisin family serine protease